MQTSIDAWLKDAVKTMAFGEVAVKLVVHNGQVKRIEKTVTTKEQET